MTLNPKKSRKPASETQETTNNWRQVYARWLGGHRTEIDIRGAHKLKSDEIPLFGGEDTGPMPTELLLASLASCMALAVAHVARKREITLSDIKVEVSAEKDLKAFRFDEINVLVWADLSQTRLEDLVKRAKGYCFVTNTLLRGVTVNTNAQSLESSEPPHDQE